MSQSLSPLRSVLHVITCAAPPAKRIQEFITLAQAAGWTVCVIATPQALSFINQPLLEQLTGYPVRSQYKRPEDPDTLPRADALVVLPTTFNTLNKCAYGITDTLALGLLCEYIGLGKPVMMVPNFWDFDMGRHPILPKSLATLREWGVRILYEPESYPPSNTIPWRIVLDELHQLIVERLQEEEERGTL